MSKANTEFDTMALEGNRTLPPLLRRAWYHMTQAFRRRLTHLGLTPHQFTVLRWLDEDTTGELTQRRLAELMASDPNTVTSVLSRMESADLIERKQHPRDKRAKSIHLKAQGRMLYKKAQKVANDLKGQVMGVLPPAKRQQFLRDLEAVADAAQAACDESEHDRND